MELETTICHPNANSYITLAQAETLLTDRIASSDDWNTLTDNQKNLALYLSASAISTFNFKGKPVTKNQGLPHPRYKTKNEKQYKSFFFATRSENLRQIVSSGDLEISDNKLYDRSSSADIFYNALYYQYLDYRQMIKQSGLSCAEYLTVKYISNDGEYIEIAEDISDESAPSSGVDIYATPVFGLPEGVKLAQAELAYQVTSKLILENINEMPELAARRIEMGNTKVWFQDKLIGQSKFSTDRTNSLDIIYYYLSDWISSTGGRLV